MEIATQLRMIEEYLSGTVSLKDICQRFQVHRSTLWRTIQKYREDGPEGLAHKLRGRPSNNGKPHAFRKQVCDLYALEYKPRGVNYWRFYHEVAQSLPEHVSFSTVRRWLLKEGARE